MLKNIIGIIVSYIFVFAVIISAKLIEKKGKEKALFYCYHNKKRKISQNEKENK